MQPIIVFDLRDHHIVAGILDIVDGQFRWKPEPVLVRHREEGSPDPVFVADLCFFRPLHGQQWIPILSDGIGKLPGNYDRIMDLFGKVDREDLQSAVKTGLYPLFQPLLNARKDLEILLLVDSYEIQECLTEIFQKLPRFNRIVVPKEAAGSLTGFALLGIDKTLESQEGQILVCSVGDDVFGFRWNNTEFEKVQVDKNISGAKWNSLPDLERAGILAFELVWGESLVEPIKIRLEALTRENNLLISLLERMEQICGKLNNFTGRSSASSA